MARLTKRMRACLELVASDAQGILNVYDERLDQFCDDSPLRDGTDTINRCFEAKLLEQYYDGDSDNGTIVILPAGRRALDEATHDR